MVFLSLWESSLHDVYQTCSRGLASVSFLLITSIILPWLCLADQDPALAGCIRSSRSKTGRDSNTSKVKPVYPACAYSQAQLTSMLEIMGEWMAQHGYTVPAPCESVLVGETLGGTDSIPVTDATTI